MNDPEPQTEILLKAAAQSIVRKRMEGPAKLFLEMHKPLTGVLQNVMLVSEPLLSLFLGPRHRNLLNYLFESPANVDRFVQLMEEAERERGK